MTAIFNGKMKYLFLIPIVILILFAYLNLSALTKLNAELMKDKKGSVQANIDCLADMIDTSVKQGKVWNKTDYEYILGSVITDINGDTGNVFAALYDQNLRLVSGSVSGANLKIYDIKQLSRQDLFAKPYGWAETSYIKNGTQKIPMYVYFKWIPNDTPGSGYLLTAGAGAENLTINQGDWLAAAMIAQLAVTFLMNTAFVALLCYLGAIYASRNGVKWRKPW